MIRLCDYIRCEIVNIKYFLAECYRKILYVNSVILKEPFKQKKNIIETLFELYPYVGRYIANKSEAVFCSVELSLYAQKMSTLSFTDFLKGESDRMIYGCRSDMKFKYCNKEKNNYVDMADKNKRIIVRSIRNQSERDVPIDQICFIYRG